MAAAAALPLFPYCGYHGLSPSIHALAVVHLWTVPYLGHFSSNVKPSRDRNMTVSVFRPVPTDLPITGQWIRILGI